MILEKYENIYKKFIDCYKEVHVNPWHELSKKQLDNLHNRLVKSFDIVDDFGFYYFMNRIIKGLSGKEDAHTQLSLILPLPLHFKVFDEVFLTYPQELKHSKLLSINNVDIKTILAEMDEVIVYGTAGRAREELELALTNKFALLGLPSLRDSDKIVFEIEKPNGERLTKNFDRGYIAKKQDIIDYYDKLYGPVASYKFLKNTLVFCLSSLQPRFENKIKETTESLKKEDLSKIDTIIVDLRGNTGGNATLSTPLIEFVKQHSDKKLYCLTDYKIFSGGRYALRDFIDLGAVTVGEEISTPINCYGNSHWTRIDGYNFSISEAYFNPFKHIDVYTKEDFNSLPKTELSPIIFRPDVKVTPTKENFLNDEDVVLAKALELSQTGQKEDET